MCAIYVRAIYVRAMCVLRACAVRAMCVLCACYARATCVGVLGACSVRASQPSPAFRVFFNDRVVSSPQRFFKVTCVKGTQPSGSLLPTLRFHEIRENMDFCHVRIAKEGVLMGNLDRMA